jgi:hypothetical protein
MPGTHLQADRVIATCELLGQRIRERFPQAGLNDVCQHLIHFARAAEHRSREISRPMYGIRLLSALFVLLFLGGIAGLVAFVQLPEQPLQAGEFVQAVEAGLSMTLLILATSYFLASFESRVKRNRALRAMHELRSLAHVIDMHQLTKDPERVMHLGEATASSPKYNMTRFQLGRYLDYCTEMLALCGKIGALYVDNFTDEEAVKAGNDLEELTNGLARKIWQKINVLYTAEEAEWQRSARLKTQPQLPFSPPDVTAGEESSPVADRSEQKTHPEPPAA